MAVIDLSFVEDFVAELENSAPHVAWQTVRVQINRTPMQKEELSFQLDFWATMLVKPPDQEPIIFELALVAGKEFKKPRNDDEKDGATRKCLAWVEQIKAAGDKHGIKVRPGRIEVM